MCGIVGTILNKPGLVKEHLTDLLKQLEYRGYDSCGIYFQDQSNHSIAKEIGRVNLSDKHDQPMLLGIGHTRWATHGRVMIKNTHPINTRNIYVVHNGVIDNYAEIKYKLENVPYRHKFITDTDTEVISQMVAHYRSSGFSTVTSLSMTVMDLRGKYSLVLADSSERGTLIAYKQGCPLIIFKNSNGIYVSSDLVSFSGMESGKIFFLPDDHLVKISNEEILLFSKYSGLDETPIQFKFAPYTPEPREIADSMRTIMESEIHQQPITIEDTLSRSSSCVEDLKRLNLSTVPGEVKIKLIGCGTSFHAAQIGARWIRELAGLNAEAQIASEFAISSDFDDSSVYVFISQSGETADVLAAVDRIEHLTDRTISICNVEHSELVRRTKIYLPLEAGTERSVASTKAFTSQLVVLMNLAISLAEHETGDNLIATHLRASLSQLPKLISDVLSRSADIKKWSSAFDVTSCALFIGRSYLLPVLQEGALKLAEIAYIPSLTYSIGELKHGPLALISNGEPVITIISKDDSNREKIYSTLKQVESRGGKVFAIAEETILEEAVIRGVKLSGFYVLPSTDKFNRQILPILSIIPLQLLSHEVAISKGRSVDTPRNLAKSCTVE